MAWVKMSGGSWRGVWIGDKGVRGKIWVMSKELHSGVCFYSGVASLKREVVV